jgi:hypothetical protein
MIEMKADFPRKGRVIEALFFVSKEYFLETFTSLIFQSGVYYNPYFTINHADTVGGLISLLGA